MTDIIKAFSGFMGNYAMEALNVASALDSLLEGTILPADHADKVRATIATLKNAVANINHALANNPPVMPTVVINETDIETAVKSVLPDMIKSALEAAPPPVVDIAPIIAAVIAALPAPAQGKAS